jgi:acetaldehyde dehydrogenase / alcohol dehydrogenase
MIRRFVSQLPRSYIKTNVRNLSLTALMSTSEVDDMLLKMRKAQDEFSSYSQAKTDHIFESVSHSMKKHVLQLAKNTVAESGIGQVEDKVLKNLYACEYNFAKFKDLKTAGVIFEDKDEGIVKVAEPVGTICALVPCTNPVCTVLMKGLASLKTRNCILFAPHPRTQRSCIDAIDLMYQYAVDAGAPVNCMASIVPKSDLSSYVMRHKDIKFLLATGGPGMVNACYTSGKPAIGVGPGNAPVLIDDTYNLKEALHSVVAGKCYDNGVICASENSVIVMQSAYEEAKTILRQRGVHILNRHEQESLGQVFMPDGKNINPLVVGKSANCIAEMAGLSSVSSDTVLLCVEAESVGHQEVFSHEKLCPIITLYSANSFGEGVDLAKKIAEHGGEGHTSAIYSNDPDRVTYFQTHIPTYHIPVNMPSSFGVIGIRYNTGVDPTMTVGVGSKGGSMSSTNVGPQQLFQVKIVNTKKRTQKKFMRPHIVQGSMPFRDAFQAIRCKHDLFSKKALLVIGESNGDAKSKQRVQDVKNELRRIGYHINVLENVTECPDQMKLDNWLTSVKTKDPSVIVAFGDGTVIDTAKLLRLLIDNPAMSLDRLCDLFLESKWRDDINKCNIKTPLVTIPTLIGGNTGIASYVHFKNGQGATCPVRFNAFLPDTVVLNYVDKYTAETPNQGFVSLIQAIESFVSIEAIDESKSLAKEAASELMHTIGMNSPSGHPSILKASVKVDLAVANSSLGLASAMALAFQNRFGVPQEKTLGLFAVHVLRFNASSTPRRVNPSPNFPCVATKEAYVELAHDIGVPGESDDDVFSNWLSLLIGLNISLHHHTCLKDCHLEEAVYRAAVGEMAEEVFCNQMAAANPRFALLSEIEELFLNSY